MKPTAHSPAAERPSTPSPRVALERCYSCPLGLAAGVAEHRACPFVPREREAGAHVYVEGDTADRVWYIVSGYVALSRETSEARSSGVTWAVRRPGEMLGTEGLVSDTYRDSAVALNAATLCVAPRDVVDAWLGPEDSPARAVLQLALRTRCNEVPRRSCADGNATRRVASWLLDEAPSQNAPQIPRQIVAGLLGMLPETFSRALARLVKLGAIEIDRRTIRVVDLDALLRAAGEGEGEGEP
nr:Crp/Fnr family transcriptional regulator [Deltaproteobacteria bacterium]